MKQRGVPATLDKYVDINKLALPGKLMLMAEHTLQQVGLAIKMAQNRHHREFNARLGALGLSLVQWDALRHLHAHADASLHDLARLTFQSDQAFGALAGRMIDRGLLERIEGPGRAIRHRITSRGQALLEQGSTVVDEVLTESLAPLTARQLNMLGDLLDRLNRGSES